MLGAIEAGGTKFVCGVGDTKGKIHDRISFPTTNPEETMRQVVNYFKSKKFDAMGVGSFGPIDPIPESDTYGYITSTPKTHWSHYNLIGGVKEHFDVPMFFDTDVNGAALGEYTWGAARGLSSCLYVTVGTGIGAGAVVGGALVQGLTHPEMGHILVRRHPEDHFEGSCPYHKDCLEGLASGTAISKRWNTSGANLPKDHLAWEIEAFYLAQALMNYILILSPQKIIMGGGVMQQASLYQAVSKELKVLLNGYVQHEFLDKKIEEYVVHPALGDNAGLSGALALAQKALL